MGLCRAGKKREHPFFILGVNTPERDVLLFFFATAQANLLVEKARGKGKLGRPMVFFEIFPVFFVEGCFCGKRVLACDCAI